MGCARCHDHKYDPISQRDYYRLFAAFNTIQESGIIKEVPRLSPPPVITLPTREEELQLAKLGAERKQLETELKSASAALTKEIDAWEKTSLATLAPVPAKGSLVHFTFDQDGADHGPSPVKARTIGTLTNGPGLKGKAAVFDATQYIEFAEPRPVERDRPFTLSTWIMPGKSPQGCVASKMDSDAEARGFEILWYKSRPRINLAHRYGSDAIEVVARQDFENRQWHQLVITYDGSSRAAGLRVYVDGSLIPLDVHHDTLSGSVASAEPWRIGWKGSGIGFEGSVDEFRLFDRALSADEVGALHWREFLEGTLGTPRTERSQTQSEKLASYYITRHGSEHVRRLSRQVIALRSPTGGRAPADSLCLRDAGDGQAPRHSRSHARAV